MSGVQQLKRQIKKIQSSWAKESRKLEQEEAPPEKLQELEFSMVTAVEGIEKQIDWIESNRLCLKARSLDVVVPPLSRSEMWQREEFGPKIWLTQEGRAHVRKLIHEERKRRVEAASRWIPLLSVVLAIIGTITSLVALTLQRKTAETAAIAAGTARIGAELARQQAVALQQAVVRIQIPEFVLMASGVQPALQTGLRNEGIATATKVSFQGMLAWKAEPAHTTIGEPVPINIEIPAMPQGDKGGRGYTFTIPELTQDVLKLIRQSTKTRTIEFSGKLTYVNGFDQVISENTCKDYFAREQSDMGFIDCDQYAAKVKWWANHEQGQKDQPN